MTTVRHQAISASAGAGKTFQLAHRYIRLLALGVPAERIAALTFSRKAAGEIFDSIVTYLRLAAADEAQAAAVAERIQTPDLRAADFLGRLREVLSNLHRLHIGTLDSFTVGVVRAFPLELGVRLDFTVMDNDGGEAATARREVLSRIFDRRLVERAAQDEFLEAYKQSTFGQESKGLSRNLDQFVQEYHQRYLLLQDARGWGAAPVIWPEGSRWLQPVEDLEASAASLQVAVEQSGWTAKTQERWLTFIQAVVAFGPGSPWTREVAYLLEKLLPVLDELDAGKAEVTLNRVICELDAGLCADTLALVRHILSVEIVTGAEQTRGIHRILTRYEEIYHQQIRRQGRLTFDDAQLLLTQSNPFGTSGVLSRNRSAVGRLFIDDRLDARLDHWLLDEFQDTSDLQWEVLRNLADEVLQDPTGQRSFFYVGDVKQAIYGWRGGNAALFRQILDRYRPAIEELDLATSFRSCEPIIECVNQVFDALPADSLMPGSIETWNDVWKPHRAQVGAVPTTGVAALLEPACGDTKPTAEDRYGVVVDLLRDVDPLGRGLSVAILVRSNEQGRALVDRLRSECPGMPVAHEGRAAITDNPVVALLLSLVKYAFHPGDSFAHQHLEMSPLGHGLASPLDLLRQIHERGFRDFLHGWGRRLQAVSPLDAFGRKRWLELVDAAGEFDEQRDRDGDAFLQFVENVSLHEPAAEQAVRVMTVHQSKGLGFDVVILPELQGRSLVGGAVERVTARNPEDGRPAWVLKMPRRLIAENDEVLSEQLRVADEASCFESLCVLYVAMTRAKQALYMVTSFPGKASKAFDAAALLKAQFGERRTFGDVHWYDAIPRTESVPAVAEAGVPAEPPPSVRKRLMAVAPSGAAPHPENAGHLFAPQREQIFDLGTAVHALFELVEWSDELDAERLAAEWSVHSGFAEELTVQAAAQFVSAMKVPEIQAALARPAGTVELWREKRFEIVMGEEWVTGMFDRVTIERDGEGKAVRAEILDYKSNDVDTDEAVAVAADGYRAQLALYRRALAIMLKLGEKQISCALAFARPGRVVRICLR